MCLFTRCEKRRRSCSNAGCYGKPRRRPRDSTAYLGGEFGGLTEQHEDSSSVRNLPIFGARGAIVLVRGREVVAVVPAAGQSRRLAPLPCSKEVLPVGFGIFPGMHGAHPKVVSHYLLECLRNADVRKTYVVIRRGKWDIPAYWGDGKIVGMDLAYVVIKGSSGPPETIDRAYSFVKDNIVAFGFPDILFRPKDVFAKLLARLDCAGCDVVLALFPAHDTTAMDMVEMDGRYRIRAIRLKPRKTRLKYAWLSAVWTPVFTEFLHKFLHKMRSGERAGLIGNRKIDPQGDIPVGALLREAIRAKLHVEGVMFSKGSYLDVGTPDHLSEAGNWLSST